MKITGIYRNWIRGEKLYIVSNGFAAWESGCYSSKWQRWRWRLRSAINGFVIEIQG